MEMYNKLVRDNIPDIIRSNGENPVTRILSDEEYIVELNRKLLEEVNEYLNDNDTSEIADILEVIRAILDFNNISYEDMENIRIKKANKRGSFKEKIYLEKV
ncbi:MAG: nucleoside triphosphate pyrophosphohydrolase [Bacilli bacterium]|nr:nucleoside triphosphate pyrophosphohydrolase [Bacilli bacterium]